MVTLQYVFHVINKSIWQDYFSGDTSPDIDSMVEMISGDGVS